MRIYGGVEQELQAKETGVIFRKQSFSGGKVHERHAEEKIILESEF